MWNLILGSNASLGGPQVLVNPLVVGIDVQRDGRLNQILDS